MGRGESGGGGGGSGGGLSNKDFRALSGVGTFEFSLSELNSNPEMMQLYQAAGLTKVEAATVLSYTGPTATRLNDKLNNGTLTSGEKVFVKQLNSGLSKLPDVKGEVFRGSRRDRNLNVGDTFTSKSFWSSSSSRSTADKFSGDTVVYKIRSKTGKNISKLSNIGGESEVLFRSNTSFSVTGVSTGRNSRTGNPVTVYEITER